MLNGPGLKRNGVSRSIPSIELQRHLLRYLAGRIRTTVSQEIPQIRENDYPWQRQQGSRPNHPRSQERQRRQNIQGNQADTEVLTGLCGGGESIFSKTPNPSAIEPQSPIRPHQRGFRTFRILHPPYQPCGRRSKPQLLPATKPTWRSNLYHDIRNL